MKFPREIKPVPLKRHTIADHAFGDSVGHVHEPGADHDHDHDHDGLDLLPSEGGGAVVLTSIGIDVGSSGTQLAIARLYLEERAPAVAAANASGATEPATGAASASVRIATRRRETLYQSPVYLTPFASACAIDVERLDAVIDEALAAAGIGPDDIDCGVVLLTGAAREKENAGAITECLARRCGDIVSAAAGHHLEARIAASGSGALARSARFGQRYLNLDIGGATTKLAVCDAGRVTATAALAVGGRLVATDAQDRIVRLEPAGIAHAQRAGLNWEPDGVAPFAERKRVAGLMADDLVAALRGVLSVERSTALSLTGPLPSLDGISGVVVSGGVGEYVYGRESRSFGDMGLPLGRALAARVDAGLLPFPLLPAGECIRATVLGASSYTVQLSGRTGTISDPAALLPRRNVPVLRPDIGLAGAFDAESLARSIDASLARLDASAVDAAEVELALALSFSGPPEHIRLRTVAEGVKRGLAARTAAGKPIYILADADIAASLGAILTDELSVPVPVLVLDGLVLADLDYVDLGRLRLPSGSVPVTIKSLVFRDEPRQKRPPRRGRAGAHRV